MSGPGKHVIIGGLGNLGRHLQRALLAQNYPVRVLDRTTDQVNDRLVHSSVDYVPYQLGDNDSLPTLVTALRGAETVYSVVTPDVQFGTVGDFKRTNHLGMQHLVMACRDAGVAKLVLGSSLAVTNHLVPSYEQSEDDPLPPIESYASWYDRSKRLGEETVLQANQTNGLLRTCALRFSGLIASPTDYMFRDMFRTGLTSQKIITTKCRPADVLAAADAADALVRANDRLYDSDTPLAGRAVFVTKSRNEISPSANLVGEHVGQLMNWQVQYIPKFIFSSVQNGYWLQHAALRWIRDEDNLRGIPMHLYLEYTNHEQTFNNSLAKELLGFQPHLSWQEAVESIVETYRNSQTK